MFKKLFVSLLLVLFFGGSTYAQIPSSDIAPDFNQENFPAQTECLLGRDQASALTELNGEATSLYAKFENPSAKAQDIQVFYQNLETYECKSLGNVSVNSESWAKAGTLVPTASELTGVVILYAPEGELFEGNYPSLAFMPEANAPCELKVVCTVTYQDQQLTLLPRKISMSIDTLRLYQYKSFTDAKVNKVVYAVDEVPVYEKQTLEPFNYRYVSGGEHDLQTVVQLSDGQRLLKEQKFDESVETDISLQIQSFLYQNGKLFRFFAWAAGIVAVFYAALFIARAAYRKKIWEETHLLYDTSKLQKVYTGASEQKILSDENEWIGALKVYKKTFIGLAGIFVAFIILQSFFLITVRTDGLSMFPTLKDRQLMLVSKTPLTISKINNRTYIPKRGDIVIFKKENNNVFAQDAGVEEYIVKRVIALPNERVTIKKGKITVYNDQRPEGFEPDVEGEWASVIAPTNGVIMDSKLGVGELFVSGDNRDGSIDSRMYGPIKADQVIGKLVRKL